MGLSLALSTISFQGDWTLSGLCKSHGNNPKFDVLGNIFNTQVCMDSIRAVHLHLKDPRQTYSGKYEQGLGYTKSPMGLILPIQIVESCAEHLPFFSAFFFITEIITLMCLKAPFKLTPIIQTLGKMSW